MKQRVTIAFLIIVSATLRAQVQPDFEPAQAPGVGAQMGIQAKSAAQSWMNQAQQRQIRQQQADQAQAQFQATLPAVTADAQAEVATYAEQIARAKQIQDLRAQAEVDAQNVLDEYLNVLGEGTTNGGTDNLARAEDGSPDYRTQYKVLSEILKRYGYLKSIPEHKPLMNQIEEAKRNAFEMAIVRLRGAAPVRLPSENNGTEIKRVYLDVGSTHTIEENIADGAVLLLDDRSLWEVTMLDQIDSILWLPAADITVRQSDTAGSDTDYILDNSDDSEKVQARFLGME